MSNKLYIDLPFAVKQRLKGEKTPTGSIVQLIYFDKELSGLIKNVINIYDIIDDFKFDHKINEGSELDDINNLINEKDWGFISKICLIKSIDNILVTRGFKGKLVEIVSVSIDDPYSVPLAGLNEYALALIK